MERMIIIGKEDPEKNDLAVYEAVNALRENSDFDAFISEINSKIEDFTSDRKNYKPLLFFKPKLKFTVRTSLVLTDEQIRIISAYLYDKYIDVIPGDFIILKKRHFSKEYRVISFYLTPLLLACS